MSTRIPPAGPFRNASDDAESPNPTQVDPAAHQHSVQFYCADESLMDTLSRFIGSAIGAGDAAIVIATQAHREELANRLSSRGLEVARAVEQGRYVALDAAETLSQFMVNDWPDEKRFVEVIGGVINRTKAAAHKQHGRAALFGEMVALLWNDGKAEAALMLEQLWNQIAHSHSFSLVCAYPLTKFYREEDSEIFQKICAEHSAVIPDESYTRVAEEQRLRNVTQWQQRALALENEIKERQRAQLLLQERESELSDFLENAVIPMHWVAPDGIILWANRAEMDLLGYSPEEYIGHHISEFHADQQASEDILGRLTNEQLHGYESQLRCKNGSIRDVQIHSSIFERNGQLVHTRCFILDVTEGKKAIQARGRLAAIVDSSEEVIVSKDLNGIVTSWNASAERTFGYTAEEIIGQPITLIIPPELRADEDMILSKIRNGERLEHFETVRLTKSGKRLDVSLTISPVKDEQGRIVGAAKIAHDISQRKNTERRVAAQYAVTRVLADAKSLADAAEHVLQVLCSSLDWNMGALWQVDEQDSCLTCVKAYSETSLREFEKAACARTFEKGAGLPGQAWRDNQPVWIREVARDTNFPRWGVARPDGVHSAFAFPIGFQNRVSGVMEFFTKQRRDPDEDVVKMMAAIGSEIGQFIERKRAEEALLRAEKLAATGRMAATIAHEINNPLEAITNLLYLLRSNVRGEEGRRNLALAESELERVAQITKQTLAFYREVSLPEPVNLAEVVDSVLTMFTSKMAHKRIRVVRAEQPCRVIGIQGELRQLFTNLIDNAIEAAPNNGHVEITIASRGDQVIVSVSDNGMGIPPERLSRVFEPFFTTKRLGTGLGLWVAQEIAERHRGRIIAHSSTDSSNHGTTFQVTFAAAQEDDATATTAA